MKNKLLFILMKCFSWWKEFFLEDIFDNFASLSSGVNNLEIMFMINKNQFWILYTKCLLCRLSRLTSETKLKGLCFLFIESLVFFFIFFYFLIFGKCCSSCVNKLLCTGLCSISTCRSVFPNCLQCDEQTS